MSELKRPAPAPAPAPVPAPATVPLLPSRVSEVTEDNSALRDEERIYRLSYGWALDNGVGPLNEARIYQFRGSVTGL